MFSPLFFNFLMFQPSMTGNKQHAQKPLSKPKPEKTKEMETKFHFVDALSTDRQAKKLMRQHVMRGKNAGRKLNRPTKAAFLAKSDQPYTERSLQLVKSQGHHVDLLRGKASLVAGLALHETQAIT